MKSGVTRLHPFADRDTLNVVIETPRGSRNKYKFEPDLGLMTLSKALPAGMAFPFDFGFVPETLSGDGDPLDVLVLLEDAVFPGCVVRARLLGVIKAMLRERGGKRVRNDRLIAAAQLDSRPLEVKSIRQVSRRTRDEIVRFFQTYMELEGKKFELLELGGPALARKIVDRFHRRHVESKLQEDGKGIEEA
jgi:inorganic pyrophosphatase